MLYRGILIFSAIWLFSSPASFAQEYPLQDLVRDVKVALLRVQDAAEARSLPPLEQAVLEVNTIQKNSGDGKISLVVVEIGGEISSQITNSVRLTLAPPKAGSPSDVSNIRLADQLAEAILAGARAIAIADQGEPHLQAEKLEATVKFALSREGGGGFTLSFPPFDLGAGVKLSTAGIHSISVTYKKD